MNDIDDDDEDDDNDNDDELNELNGDNQENYSLYDELDEESENINNSNNNVLFYGSSLAEDRRPGISQGSKNGGGRRNRVFIDPITEVPVLEHYFSIETYPDHFLIEKICDIINNGEYRFKFPKLEPRNVQLWFKNHRAKLKRLKTTNGSSANLETTTTTTTKACD